MKRLTLSTLLFMLLMEIGLRVVDPWGMHYFGDMRVFHKESLSNGVYVSLPGYYQTSTFSAMILPDNTRYVPDTTEASDCEIVFIGDSVTFGHGVNDADTFVNLIAANMPDVHVLNNGQSGHNMEMLLFDAAQFPEADALIYTVTNNDMRVGARRGWRPTGDELFIIAYPRYVWQTRIIRTEQEYDPVAFDWFIQTMLKDPRLYIVDYNNMTPDGERIFKLEWQYEAISLVDGHPDKESHQDFARRLTPFVRRIAQQVCNGI